MQDSGDTRLDSGDPMLVENGGHNEAWTRVTRGLGKTGGTRLGLGGHEAWLGGHEAGTRRTSSPHTAIHLSSNIPSTDWCIVVMFSIVR